MNRPLEASDAIPARRGFLTKLAAIVVGGVVGMFGLLSGLWNFLDPISRPRKPPLSRGVGDGPEGFVRVASLESIPTDGSPRRFPVVADQIDAWNFTPDQPIGAVFLRRLGNDQVLCLHSTCPHAGCSVSPSSDGQAFHCPCHNSSFDLDGNKVGRPGKENPSPRKMDELQVNAEKLALGEIWIQFQDFYTGIEQKKPKL